MKQTEKTISHHQDNEVVIKHFPGYFLIACLVFSLIFIYYLFRPFLVILVLAAILGTAFQPLYGRVLKSFKDRERLASFFTCFLILILIIIPLILFIVLLSEQAVDLYIFIDSKLESGALDSYLKWQPGYFLYDFLNNDLFRLTSIIDLEEINLKQGVIDLAKNVSSFLVSQSASLLKSIGRLMISFFLLFFALYYLFKDGVKINKKFMDISPLPQQHGLELARKFKEISKATLYGIFLTSILQGLIGGIGFMIVGIPSPIFWGTAIAFFSLIPFIGTSLVWAPASLVLILSGNLFGGIFLFLWGLFLVGTIDNFLRAYLIGNKLNMNPLLAFLAVFGGIQFFGLIGIIFGPLILTIFFTFLHIYQLEYKKVLSK